MGRVHWKKIGYTAYVFEKSVEEHGLKENDIRGSFLWEETLPLLREHKELLPGHYYGSKMVPFRELKKIIDQIIQEYEQDRKEAVINFLESIKSHRHLPSDTHSRDWKQISDAFSAALALDALFPIDFEPGKKKKIVRKYDLIENALETLGLLDCTAVVVEESLKL